MKMRLKVSSAKWRPFCFGLNELTNAGISPIWPVGTYSSEIKIQMFSSNIFIQENAFENAVCKMSAISFRPKCVFEQKVDMLT